MKKLSLFCLFLTSFTSLNLLGQELKIEPVYGFERTQRELPPPAKYVTRTYLGMRAVYGTALISGEFEVGQSLYKDDSPSDNMTVDTTMQRAMLGIRTYPIRSNIVGIFFRAGGRAQKETREVTENGVSTKTESPINLDPYAGTGITIALANAFALNAGATLIYNRNAAASEQYDTQYSFSFTIKTGTVR
jgi:hypothetical protein